MFKTIAEKKQQLDNFKKLQKSIDWIVIHWNWEFCDIYIDCSFNIIDIKIIPNVSDSEALQNDIKNVFNKAKQKATEVLQTKSKEIFK